MAKDIDVGDASRMVGAVGLGDKASADTAENEKVYNDWADSYKNTVRSWGYDAPERATSMLLAALDAEDTVNRDDGLCIIDVGRESKRASARRRRHSLPYPPAPLPSSSRP